MRKVFLRSILVLAMVLSFTGLNLSDVSALTNVTGSIVNFNYSGAGTTVSYTDYNTGQEGYLSPASIGDAAYLGEVNGKIKFMASGIVGLVDAAKVQVLGSGNYSLSYYMPVSGGKLYHYVSTNVTGTSDPTSRNYVGATPGYLTVGSKYYSYDGHYFYNDYNQMISDYQNNTRNNAVNANDPYYFYFQYLPFRSKTTYTAAQLNAYLSKRIGSAQSVLLNTGEYFIKYQNEYGVNAVLMLSLAIQESNWGKSSAALNRNNLFGLNAVDSNAGNSNTYNSIEDCIRDFAANWMTKSYLNPKHNYYRGGILGDKASGIFGKYSSDPYEGEKVASIAMTLDTYFGNADKDYYTLGVKGADLTDYSSKNVYSSVNATSTYYITPNNSPFVFLIRNKNLQQGYYEVQSDLVINNSSSYDYAANYGYIDGKNIKLVNSGNDISAGETSPQITDAKISNVTYSGYTVTAKITGANGIAKVQMPTWSAVVNNGTDQDDIQWYEVKGNDGLYTLDVKINNHQGDLGLYHTHIYAYDTKGNVTVAELSTTISKKPQITTSQISNVTAEGYTVTVTISNPENVAKVMMPTWSAAVNNGTDQDDIQWYEVNGQNGVYTLNVKTANHKNDTGVYHTHVYVYDNANQMVDKVELQETIPDNKPQITASQISDVTAEGYTVTVTISNPENVAKVMLPTWSAAVNNGTDQDDIQWYEVSGKNGTYTLNVKTANHKNDTGIYHTHIYVYDKNNQVLTTKELETKVPSNQAQITAATVSNVTTDGYTVTVTIDNPENVAKVMMPTWSAAVNNGTDQDDIQWYDVAKSRGTYTLNVKTSNHNGDSGIYHTHIYVYDKNNQVIEIKELEAEVPVNKPKITDTKISNVTYSGYTVTVTIDNPENVAKVMMPTWSAAVNNGTDQDDIQWYEVSGQNGVYTLNVKTANHKNDTGIYHTHVYVYDKNNQHVDKAELKITVPENKPEITEAKISNVTYSGYTVTAKITGANGIAKVMMPTWSAVVNNGTDQDDIQWYEVKGNDGLYTLDVKINNHKGDVGAYQTHIYAYDTKGNVTVVELNTIVPENKPEITDAKISNVTTDGYTVSAKITGGSEISRVRMPTWSAVVNNGTDQDDIQWYEASADSEGVYSLEVKRGAHNFDTGTYNTHIYAYDAKGNVTVKELVIVVPKGDAKPHISDVKVTNVSNEGYTITATATDDSQIALVRMPTWSATVNNGTDQDDIQWYEVNGQNGSYTLNVKTANHKGDTGTYNTHIYAYDNTGKVTVYEVTIEVPSNPGNTWSYVKGVKVFTDKSGKQYTGAKKVVDVSTYNGNIDWDTLKTAGDIDGVILRIASHAPGYYVEDSKFARNLAAVRRLNIPFGIYIYDYANSVEDANNEAEFVKNILTKYGVTAEELTYGIYFDMERQAVSLENNVAYANAFVANVKNAGYKVGIYSYRSLLTSTLNYPDILRNVTWMAAYTSSMGWSNAYYSGNFGWQYTSGGVLPGITGYVDISVWFNK